MLLRWIVKHGTKIFYKPQEFFNQLQWSTHHWLIMLVFLVVTAVEAHLGTQASLYHSLAYKISNFLPLSFDISLWLVVSAKLAVILLGSTLTANFIWFFGNIIGQKNSKRVLFRRLAVVFTVILSAYTASHLDSLYPWMSTLSFFLYVWGGLLGYFAIREQFALNHIETTVVGAFAALLVLTSWHYTNDFIQRYSQQAPQEIAAKPSAQNFVNKNLK